MRHERSSGEAEVASSPASPAASPGTERQDETLALLRRALGGDAPALRVIVRRLIPVVRARVRRCLARQWGRALGPQDGDDVTQDVWLVLMRDGGRQLRAWDPSRGATLEGYVAMVAEREVQNRVQNVRALKRGGDRVLLPLADAPEVASGAASPEQAAEARHLAAALTTHLDEALPERGRLVLRCLFGDGRSPGETASLLGVDVQVVYNWQHKIRAAARAFLAHDDAPLDAASPP
jgi:RNA polymerase sigma-70 factor (ECF subfamily)